MAGAAMATARNRAGRRRRVRGPGEDLRSPAAGAAGLNIVGFIVPSVLRWWNRVTTGGRSAPAAGSEPGDRLIGGGPPPVGGRAPFGGDGGGGGGPPLARGPAPRPGPHPP